MHPQHKSQQVELLLLWHHSFAIEVEALAQSRAGILEEAPQLQGQKRVKICGQWRMNKTVYETKGH